MKKTRILVLALAVALLVISVFAFSTGAEEDGNIAIISKNVSYSSNIEMMVAPDVALEDADKVVVTYYFESEPDKIYTADLNNVNNPDTVYTDSEGIKHPSFSTIGIPAKEYGERIYVAAQLKGSSSNAEYEEYSVAEYFYEKLFAQGYIFEESGDDFDRRNLYINYLNCGASAQKVLINNKYPDKAETLITDYNYVVVPSGITGAQTGFYADDSTLNLTLGKYSGDIPANKAFSSWQLYKYDSLGAEPTVAKLSDSSYELSVDAIYNFVPLFVDALPSGAGVYYNAYKNNTADGTIYDFTNETNISSVFSSWNGGAYCTVSLISDAKYVRYEKSKEYTSNIQRALSFTAADSSTDTTVVEMDMRIGGVSALTDFFTVITINNRGYARDIYLSCDKNGRIQFRNSDNYEKAEGYAGLNADEWYNVRIVISSEQNAIATESGVAEIYINNEFVCKTTLFGKGTNSGSNLVLQLRSLSTAGTYIEFDNVYVGHIAND